MSKRTIASLMDGRLELGHAMIDSEHAKIAGYWREAVQSDSLQFSLRLARLKKFMRGHFDHEAELIERIGAVMCEDHRREHQALLDLCDRALALHVGNFRRGQSLLRNKFAKLIHRHITYTDQLAVLLINSNREDELIWRCG